MIKILLIGNKDKRDAFLKLCHPHYLQSRLRSTSTMATIGCDFEIIGQYQYFLMSEATCFQSKISIHAQGSTCVIYCPNNHLNSDIDLPPKVKNIPLHIIECEPIDAEVVMILKRWIDGLVLASEADRDAEINCEKDMAIASIRTRIAIQQLPSDESITRASLTQQLQIPSYKGFTTQQLLNEEKESRERILSEHKAILFGNTHAQKIIAYQESVRLYKLKLKQIQEAIQAYNNEFFQAYERTHGQIGNMMLAEFRHEVASFHETAMQIMLKPQVSSWGRITAPQFPLSLYKKPIQRDYSEPLSHQLPATEEVQLPQDWIRELLICSANKDGTSFDILYQFINGHSHLRISRPMVANNIICAKSFMRDDVLTNKSFCINQLNHTAREQARKIAWSDSSSFLSWRNFLSRINAKHMATRGDQPFDNWMSDLVTISKNDPCPLPIYKSKITGDYWVFAWHGTGTSTDLQQAGFKMQFSKEGLYGEGFYTAVESSKGMSYVTSSPYEHEQGALLICASNLGKNPVIFTRGKGEYNLFKQQLGLNLPQQRVNILNKVSRIVLPCDSQLQYEFITPIPPTLIFEVKLSTSPSSFDHEFRKSYGIQNGDILMEQVNLSTGRYKYLDSVTYAGNVAQQVSDPFMGNQSKFFKCAHSMLFYNSNLSDKEKSLYPGEDGASLIHVTFKGIAKSQLTRVCGEKNRHLLIIRCKCKEPQYIRLN